LANSLWSKDSMPHPYIQTPEILSPVSGLRVPPLCRLLEQISKSLAQAELRKKKTRTNVCIEVAQISASETRTMVEDAIRQTELEKRKCDLTTQGCN
jgi:hypothetical protein